MSLAPVPVNDVTASPPPLAGEGPGERACRRTEFASCYVACIGLEAAPGFWSSMQQRAIPLVPAANRCVAWSRPKNLAELAGNDQRTASGEHGVRAARALRNLKSRLIPSTFFTPRPITVRSPFQDQPLAMAGMRFALTLVPLKFRRAFYPSILLEIVTMKALLTRLIREEDGAAAAEYAILLAFVAAAVGLAVSQFNLGGIFTEVGAQITTLVSSAG